MSCPLQRIIVDRDERFIFVTSGQKFHARVDLGQPRGEFEILCRSFEQARERKNVNPGWKLGLAEEWRRKAVVRKTRDGESVTHLHFQRPTGELLVLEFHYSPLPMSVVGEIKTFLASFNPAGKGADDNGDSRQPHGQPVPEEGRHPEAEGRRGVDLEVDEGLRGAQEGGQLPSVDVDGGEDPAGRLGFGVIELN